MIRVGLAGLGGIGQAHLEGLSLLENVRITRVFDVDRPLAERIAKKYGAVACGAAEACADPAHVDALFICSPPFARGDLDTAAAAAGVHVFVEKPLGLDTAAVRAKEEAIVRSGVIHSVGYCLRYGDIVQRAKDYLAGKSVEMICSHRFSAVHPPSWWSQLEKSGGQFVDQTTHQVDLIRYLSGEIAEIDARFERRALHRRNPEANIPDIGIARFTLASGAIGTIASTCLLPSGDRSYVEWIGDGFSVRIAGNELRIHDGEGERIWTMGNSPLYEQDRNFIEAVAAGTPDRILCDYAEGRRTLEVTLAANRSAEAKRPIRLGILDSEGE